MKLVINDPDGVVNYGFCVWLTSQIRSKYMAEVNIKKFSAIDKYLESLDFMERHKGQTAHIIVQNGLRNLVIKSGKDSYTICINESLSYDFLAGVKLSSLCKLINYGSLSVRGYSIITQIFTEIAENLDVLLTYYYRYVMRR